MPTKKPRGICHTCGRKRILESMKYTSNYICNDCQVMDSDHCRNLDEKSLDKVDTFLIHHAVFMDDYYYKNPDVLQEMKNTMHKNHSVQNRL
jgi:hypothetical protein